MSVCVCILCGTAQNRIVAVDDRKVTFDDFSADGAVWKAVGLTKGYWLQYAGNDVEKAPQVIEAARQHIQHTDDAGLEVGHDFILQSLQNAWREVRDREIESRFLRKHGFTFESFRDEGKQKCSEAVYDQLHDRIDRFKLSLEFLVAGFERGFGRINHLDSQGSLNCYDDLGFWAIGSGAHAALSSLAFHVDKGNLRYSQPVEVAAYFACEAKFMAESSTAVGKETSLIVHGADVPAFIGESQLAAIRRKWLKQGAPKPSKTVTSDLKKLIDAEFKLGSQLLKPHGEEE